MVIFSGVTGDSDFDGDFSTCRELNKDYNNVLLYIQYHRTSRVTIDYTINSSFVTASPLTTNVFGSSIRFRHQPTPVVDSSVLKGKHAEGMANAMRRIGKAPDLEEIRQPQKASSAM